MSAAASHTVPSVDWYDSEVGYSTAIRQRPLTLKLAIQDPTNVWPFFESTFESYQPFQGLSVKNNAGMLQKVEDLAAAVVNMQWKQPVLTSSRTRASTGVGGLFSFGSGASSSSSTPPTADTSRTASPAISPSPSFNAFHPPVLNAAHSPAFPTSLKHPMNWHLYPYIHVFIISCTSIDEYNKNVKPQLKKFIEYFTAANTQDSGNNSPISSSAPSASNGTFSSSLPDLRFHSEVLILYAPMLEDSVSAATPSFSSGGLSSLFKKSSSFSSSSQLSAAAIAEDRANQIKQSRKIFDRIKADFVPAASASGASGNSSSSASGKESGLVPQVARIDLYDMLRADGAGGSNVVFDSTDVIHQFDEFIAKIVRSLIRTHEHRSSLYEFEIKQSLAASHLTSSLTSSSNINAPNSFNYAFFFCLKESYAKLHQQMGLKIDALELYQELKEMMMELQNNQSASEKGDTIVTLFNRIRASAPSSQPNTTLTAVEDMPGPILDVFSCDFPAKIITGTLNPLEFRRYVVAQCMWLMLKLNREAAVNGTHQSNTPMPSNTYLCDILKMAQELIHLLLQLIESNPSIYPMSFARIFTWLVEAVMDVGVVCEKYLIQNYVATYQLLTNRVIQQQQEQQAKQQSAPKEKEKEKGGFTNVLASAVAGLIGPSTTSTSTTPSSSNTLAAPSPSGSSNSGSSPSLQQLTKSLKLAHEAELGRLQNLRGDLYGFLLDKLYQFGKASPIHQLKGEIRDVLEQELTLRKQGKPQPKKPGVSPIALPLSESNLLGSPSAAASAAASANSSPRIGLDDDVYADMLEEYYPHDHQTSEENSDDSPSASDEEADKNESSGTNISTSKEKSAYALFEARHQRILQCFEVEETIKPEASNSSEVTVPAKATFTDLFLELCTCCLKIYWLSGRYRLCTRVAELKACVYYSMGDYTKSLELFLTNCDRWRKDRWLQLFYPSLIMSIKAVQKLERYIEVARACLVYFHMNHQQNQASRSRTIPALTAASAKDGTSSSVEKETDRVVWSKLAALVVKHQQQLEEKQNEEVSANFNDNDHPSKRAPNGVEKQAPLLEYSFAKLPPSLPPASSSSSTSSTSPSAVPTVHTIIQVVHIQSLEEAPVIPPDVEDRSSKVEKELANNCPSFLLNCCLQHCLTSSQSSIQSVSPSSSSMYDNGVVAAEHMQRLLMHTLQHHLPPLIEINPDASSSADDEYEVLRNRFEALRSLAHRSRSFNSVFPSESVPSLSSSSESTSTTTPSVSVNNTPAKKSSSTSKHAHRPSVSGTSLSNAPVIIQSSSRNKSVSDGTMIASIEEEPSKGLPGGSFIECSLHPFFVFHSPQLFLYRKTHPLHMVLEVEVESRFPQSITIDAISIVISVNRQSKSSKKVKNKASQGQKQKQISVVVTGLSDAPRSSPEFQPLPSPLPSQSMTASSDNHLAALKAAALPTSSVEPPAAMDALNASPLPSGASSASPETMAAATVTTSASPSLSPSVPVGTAVSTSKSLLEEWTCIFRRVTLEPGMNRVYFHVFHSARDASTAAPKGENSADHPHAGASDANRAQHYSLVLRHSFAELEQLHALFEPSHAHLHHQQQPTVEKKKPDTLSTPMKRKSLQAEFAAAAPSPFHSPMRASAAGSSGSGSFSGAHRHSESKISLSVSDIWFGLGRINMWHIDLATFNSALKSRILTPAQRRKELLQKEKRKLKLSHPAASNQSAEQSDLVDVDLNANDAHNPPPSIRPPSPLYKPFSNKPRLTLELLPVPPTSLLIGKVSPFNLTVQITVDPARKHHDSADDEPPVTVEKCVLHIASDATFRLLGRRVPFNSGRRRLHRGLSQERKRIEQLTADMLSPSPPIYGLLVRNSGVTERKTFEFDARSGDVVLGTLPADCKLLLLLPVASPSHLSHLLKTQQIASPLSSVVNTPHVSQPTSPNPSRKSSSANTIPAPPLTAQRRKSRTARDEEDEERADLHSVEHSLSLDLTCSPAAPVVASNLTTPPVPSFMFSSYHSFTFMEPIQLKAHMERMGKRWFLQVVLWNRCAFPIRIKGFQLELPKGFLLQRNANQQAIDYILPPLSAFAITDSDHTSTSSSGANAASLASSTPVSYFSSNVYSMMFELALDMNVDVSAAPKDFMASEKDPKASSEEKNEELELELAYASASVGRFSLQADPNLHAATASSPSPSMLSLCWPIDVQIMSGSQDLHLVLGFPALAHMGRLMTFTVTVLHMKPQEKRKNSSSFTSLDSNATAAAPLSLMYSIQCPSNLWLLSGKQSHSFTLAPGEQKSFNVQLLPIASGYLPIPFIELKQRMDLVDVGVIDRKAIQYEVIPPARILRQFASNQQIPILPPTSFESGLVQLQHE